ncbi:MAG TPA: hypothetical protein PKE55_03105 [Kiritimatiellia bacterium]|nr:hypothetical protein [Kiritimatiellia bacterium]
MAIMTVNFNQIGISSLPADKPVLYRILTAGGSLNYAGIAQRGEVRKRISRHLGKIPGAKVHIEQFSSIDDARDKEPRVIKRNQPPYNKQGK